MNLLKRIAIFLIMFWTVGFVLTLAVQLFAHRIFDIGFRDLGTGQVVELAPKERLNLYIAAVGQEPDLDALAPVITVTGTQPQALEIAPFSFSMSPPQVGGLAGGQTGGQAGEQAGNAADSQPVFAKAVNSVTSSAAQTVTISWTNPQEGYFLASSKSLLFSTVAFFLLIFLSVLGALGLYYVAGERMLRRIFGGSERISSVQGG